MNAKAIVIGLCGLLLLATPAFADPPLAATEKAYRLLQTISSQLQEVRTSFAPSDSAPIAALTKAQEHVRIAAAHYCHVLYAAQLTAAKTALTQGKQQQALQHLRKANEVLEGCPAPPVAEPEHDHEESEFKDALAHR
jgi:hypothetical protein